MSDSVHVLQQRYYTTEAEVDEDPTESEKRAVFKAFDVLLVVYENDQDGELPSFCDLVGLASPGRLSKTPGLWFNSPRWNDAIEDLLERSFPFESKLADFLIDLKWQQQIRNELAPNLDELDSD